MSIKIATDSVSGSILRYLGQAQKETQGALKNLASGSRFAEAGKDAAGFAISEFLKGQVLGLEQSRRNAQQAVSMIQVAEGSLNEQNNILIRMRELAVQSASDTVSDVEREFINQEFTQLISEVDRIAKTTRFGDRDLLQGSSQEMSFQVGANAEPINQINYTFAADTRADSLELSDLTVSEKEEARDALAVIDRAVTQMGESRSGLSAIQSRLHHASEHLGLQTESLEQARSQIADTDVAVEAARLAKSKIMQEVATAALAQANVQSERVLQLLDK